MTRATSYLLTPLLTLLLLAQIDAAFAAGPKKDQRRADEKKPSSNAQTDSKKEGAENALKKAFGPSSDQSDAPLFIKSDSLNLNSKQRVFMYQGNVEVSRGDLTITANAVEGRYDDSNKIQTVLCRGNVVITRGDTLRATANKALYTVAKETIQLTEAPELFHNGSALAADKITVFLRDDRSEAEGNVRVKVIKTDEVGGLIQ